MSKVKQEISKAAWLKMAKKFVGDNVKLLALAGEAIRYVTNRKGNLKTMKDDVLLLCAYIRDVATGRYKGYKVWHLTVIVAAILYIVSPIDVIPDFLVGGFLDDMSILAWAFSKVGTELNMYKALQDIVVTETASADQLALPADK